MFAKALLLVFLVALIFGSEAGARSIPTDNGSASSVIPKTSPLDNDNHGNSEQKPTTSNDIAIHSTGKQMKDTDDGLQWQECFFNLFKCIP